MEESKLSKTNDTKRKSASEALVNSFGGYPIAYALGIVILPLSVGWIQEDPLTANLLITTIFASVSFARTYFLRRIFARFGIDDNFIKLGVKSFRRVRMDLEIRRSLFYRKCEFVKK